MKPMHTRMSSDDLLRGVSAEKCVTEYKLCIVNSRKMYIIMAIFPGRYYFSFSFSIGIPFLNIILTSVPPGAMPGKITFLLAS